jgi:radical SAM superfamily enzyme YgiQ (UPF0313 family)
MTKRERRAALVYPHDPKYHGEREMLNRISHVEGIENFPSLGLLSIAPFFGPEWDLTFVDEDRLAQEGKPRDYLGEDFDMVLLTAMNHQAYQAYRIARHFRQRGIHTVMGGPHASALPGEAARHVDTVVTGEGEEVMPRLLLDFDRGKPLPLYSASGRQNLSSLPPPRFDVVKEPGFYNKIPLFATRGCPRHCSFCCLKALYGPIYRKKTPRQVAGEIEAAKGLLPDPFISFADENMLADRRWAGELAEAIAPLGVKWEAYCDVSAAEHPEMLEMLARSGCVELLIGFETLCRESLKSADPWKAMQVEKYAACIKRIQDAGIGVLACFVVGFDHDGPDTFNRLRDFLLENPVFELDIAALTPMPGTPLHQRLAMEGRLFSRKWDDYTWYHVNFQPMHLSAREITDGIRRVFSEFYAPGAVKARERTFRHIQERIPDPCGRQGSPAT